MKLKVTISTEHGEHLAEVDVAQGEAFLDKTNKALALAYLQRFKEDRTPLSPDEAALQNAIKTAREQVKRLDSIV